MKNIFYFLIILPAIAIQGNTQCCAKVSAGVLHTLALKNNGNLWAWGNNGNGQLGNGTYACRYVYISFAYRHRNRYQ